MKTPYFSILVLSLSLNWAASVQAHRPMSLDKEAYHIAKNIQKIVPEGYTILIQPFTDLNGKVTAFGRFLSEKIRIHLANGGDVKVIEQSPFDAILEDHSKKMDKVEDANNTLRVTGTTTELKKTITLHVKIVDSKEGFLEDGFSYPIKKNKHLTHVLETLKKTDPSATQVEDQQSRRAIEEIMNKAILARIRNAAANEQGISEARMEEKEIPSR